jgi:putative ABC transport system substrate-binding protein
MTRSGGNLTGVSSKVPIITLLKTLQEIQPVNNIGVIYSSREAGSLVQQKELRRLSAQLGISVEDFNAITPAGFDSGLAALIRKVDCLLVSESTVAQRNFDRIIRKANEAKIPVVSVMPDAADRGALVALEVNPTEQGQLAGELAARVLGGAKVGALAIVTPKKTELMINLKTAHALDLQVPFSVLSNATKIIK